MADTYADYREAVEVWILDKSGIDDYESVYRQALKSALRKYSSLKPRNIGIKEVTATGVRLYDLPSSSDTFPWEDEFSDHGFKVEYPVSDTALVPSYIPDGAVDLYINTSGVKQLRFVENEDYNILPASGEKFRLRYSVLHELLDNKCTIPNSHFDAVVKLIASNVCQIYASRLAQSSDASITEGQRQAPSGAQSMETRAKDYYRQAIDLLFPKTDENKAAFAIGEFKQNEFNRKQQSVFQKTESGRKASDF